MSRRMKETHAADLERTKAMYEEQLKQVRGSRPCSLVVGAAHA
jgi:hypothetical protein